MIDNPTDLPSQLEALEAETLGLGFEMASSRRTGALLALLAASKPESCCLELGTGTGLSAAWILHGLDSESSLLSVDTDSEVQAVAQRLLGKDTRLELLCSDAGEHLGSWKPGSFDLIFADAWPGKFEFLEQALDLLRVGGFYVIDDLLPQPNWPDGHAPKVPRLMEQLEAVPRMRTLRLPWCTGLMLAVRTG